MYYIFFLFRQLSLSPPIFGKSIATIFFPFYFGNAIGTNPLPQFFFPSILTMPLPQMHCHKKKKKKKKNPPILAMPLPQINCYHFFFPFISAMPFHKSIATIFFPFISSVALPQINHKFFFFFKFLPKISATWLPQFFFSPIFDNLVATIHIFSLLHSLQFRQLGCHNWFSFRALPLAAFWAFHI